MNQITVQHKGKPDRFSRWNWKRKDGMINWDIRTYLDGYYQASAYREGRSEPEDFQANIDALLALSPDVFEVKSY